MSLALGAPLALLLAGLVALPVVAHLTRRRPTERVAFGAMLLVRRLVKRLRRRRTLHDRLLLALRALALLALALAASGPELVFEEVEPPAGGASRVVLVVDRSLSMGWRASGPTLLERARAAAAERVRAQPDGVALGLVSYAAGVEVHTTELSTDRDVVLAAIDDLTVSPASGDLRGALLAARRLLDGRPGQVLVFTDEAGPEMVPAAAEEAARLLDLDAALVPVPIHANPPSNLAVTAAAWEEGLEGGQVTLRVASFGPEAATASCEVRLPGGTVIPVFADVPAGGVADVKVTVPRDADGGVASATCEDPALPLDDTRWFHLPGAGASRVLVVDGSPGDTPTESEVYFLERALAPWGGAAAGLAVDVVAPAGVSRIDTEVHPVVFVANVADPAPLAGPLRAHLRAGGGVVLGMGSQVTIDRYNAALGDLLPAPLAGLASLADPMEAPVALAMPETADPLFRPFSRGGRAGFRRAGVWRVAQLAPYEDRGDVTTLLRTATGVPVLVRRVHGRGALLLWTSTFDRAWTDLPLQAVFVPLVQQLVSTLGADATAGATRIDVAVGEVVDVAVPDGLGTDLQVEGPSGEATSATLEGGAVRVVVTEAGPWTVRVAGGPPVALLAANVAGAESDVRRTTSLVAASAAVRPEAFTRRVQLAPAALWGGALALALAGLLAPLRRADDDAEAPASGGVA